MANVSRTWIGGALLIALLAVLPLDRQAHAEDAAVLHASKPPNILFIIMDDVGIDQLGIFNTWTSDKLSELPNLPATPNIDAVATAGIRFTNLMTMPECSPSRATFFTGRLPLRTGVTEAIVDVDLAGAQVSPYEVTTPQVLATANYTSALFGKFHLGGPDNNPDAYNTPSVLGWDYYDGNLQGAPPFIDTTLGGQYTEDNIGDEHYDPGKYSCGFPTGVKKGGCWFQNAPIPPRFDNNDGQGYSGNQCVTLGGIPALNAKGEFTLECSASAGCRVPDFNYNNMGCEGCNGYYAWRRVINDQEQTGPATPTTVRQYMTTYQTDQAIQWIQYQSKMAPDEPWMVTVSFDAIHTPYQPPPDELRPQGSLPLPKDLNCANSKIDHGLSNLMVEAMDQEIGRLLVNTGLAQRSDSDGGLIYRPEATNTMIIMVGDNGTYFASVKPPYNPGRSKGTPYQTGVSTPLIVAGPLVNHADRDVDAMVNGTDLFELFGQIAGVEVRDVVPPQHQLDSVPMLRYLTHRKTSPLREFNFTQLGDGMKAPSTKLYPCVFKVANQNICTDFLISSQDLCEAELGTWFGPGADPPYDTCCELRASNPNGDYGDMEILPRKVWAVRNDTYKLVVSDWARCDKDNNPYEFYDLRPTPRNPVNPLGLDNGPHDLLKRPVLGPKQLANLEKLYEELLRIVTSEPRCPGDGNLDKVVNSLDLVGVQQMMAAGGGSSVFDFNHDGLTNDLDRQIVLDHYGTDCLAQGEGALSADQPGSEAEASGTSDRP